MFLNARFCQESFQHSWKQLKLHSRGQSWVLSKYHSGLWETWVWRIHAIESYLVHCWQINGVTGMTWCHPTSEELQPVKSYWFYAFVCRKSLLFTGMDIRVRFHTICRANIPFSSTFLDQLRTSHSGEESSSGPLLSHMTEEADRR